jgi:hypothetical protein
MAAIVQKYLDSVAILDIQGAYTLVADDAIYHGADGKPFDNAIMTSRFGPGTQRINPIEQEIIGTTCGRRQACQTLDAGKPRRTGARELAPPLPRYLL